MIRTRDDEKKREQVPRKIHEQTSIHTYEMSRPKSVQPFLIDKNAERWRLLIESNRDGWRILIMTGL